MHTEMKTRIKELRGAHSDWRESYACALLEAILERLPAPVAASGPASSPDSLVARRELAGGHVPGPWRYEPDIGVISARDGNGGEFTLARMGGGLSDVDADGAGQMLAAASDMAAALNEWVATFSGLTGAERSRRVDECLKITRRVLARATGRDT